MRQLVPTDAEVDVEALFAADHRAPFDRRPWLLINMVASVDGGTTVQGRSGGLGGPADQRVFHAIRAVADVILVGASTVRTEDYGPPRPTAGQREQRAARGQAPCPRLAVVSRSLALDPGAPLFTDADEPPLVITTTDADRRRRAALDGVAEVVEVGTGSVDLVHAAAALRDLRLGVVLAEGGPSLNGQLVDAGLVDELCLSVSPLLLAGPGRRLADGGAVPAPLALDLDRALTEDGYLFLRYLRRDAIAS